MRLHHVITCAVLLIAAPAFAQSTPAKPSKYYVSGKNVPVVPVAAWMDGAATRVAAGASEVAKAPNTAVKYTRKAVDWPTGTVSVLTFTKAGGGVLHQITKESEIFVVKGAITANVDGTPTVVRAGDVVRWPKGALTSAEGGEDTQLVTWTVASMIEAPKPTVVRGATAPEALLPDPHAKVLVKRFVFPGNSIREAHIAKGGHTEDAMSPKTDSLIHFLSGHMRFHEDDEVHEVYAGDFVREVAGKHHHWEPQEDTHFVTTSGVYPGGGPIDPAQSTDRPATR